MYKKLYTTNKWDLFHICKVGSPFENQLCNLLHPQKKNHMTMQTNAEKTLAKIDHPPMIKNFSKFGI